MRFSAEGRARLGRRLSFRIAGRTWGLWRWRDDPQPNGHGTALYVHGHQIARGSFDLPLLCKLGIHKWGKPGGASINGRFYDTYRCGRRPTPTGGCGAYKDVERKR